jgi:hypothetical protein
MTSGSESVSVSKEVSEYGMITSLFHFLPALHAPSPLSPPVHFFTSRIPRRGIVNLREMWKRIDDADSDPETTTINNGAGNYQTVNKGRRL